MYYNDADLEMAELEDAGNRFARRFRGYTGEQIADLNAGATVRTTRVVKSSGERYEVLVKAEDGDEIGACDFRYSLDGSEWFTTAKAARLAAS